MKKFNLFKMLAVLIVLITSINTAWADQELKGVYMKYTFNGSNNNYEYYSGDKNSNPVLDLGTLTTGTFTITEVYWKTKDNWKTHKINAYGWYNMGSGDTKFAEYQNYSGSNTDDCDCEHEIQNTSVNTQIYSATGNSGNFTFSHWWIANFHWSDDGYNPTYCSNNNQNYNFTFTVLPPNATAITASATSGALSGTGTEDDPFLVAYNGSLTISLSGSAKARNDDNSEVQYSVDGGENYGTTSGYYTKTLSSITATTLQNYVFKARCYNSSASLESPSITEKTVYYKVSQHDIDYTAPSNGSYTIKNGSASAVSSDISDVIYGNTITLSATPNEGYEFTSWTVTGATPASSTSATTTFTMPNNDVTVAATFTDTRKYYYKGASADGWNTASNWTRNAVPGSTDDVIVLTALNAPSGTTTVNSVRIATDGDYTPVGGSKISANGSLTIPGSAALKVVTNIQNCAIEDNAPGSTSSTTSSTLEIAAGGALAWGTSSSPGNATVGFYTVSGGVPGSQDAVNDYFGIPFTSLNSDAYYNAWVFAVSGTTWGEVHGASLSPWTGYNIIEMKEKSGDTGGSYSLTGTLVSSGASVGSGVTAGTETLYANSWVAPIEISKMSITGTATVYLFTPASFNGIEDPDDPMGNYATYPVNSSSGSYIPSMKSFSVVSSTVSVDYATAVYGQVGGAYSAPRRARYTDYRQAIWDTQDSLFVTVKSASGWGDELKMFIHNDFSQNYENGWDGPKMEGMWEAPKLYTLNNEGEMAVSCVPSVDNNVIAFHAGTASNEYTFTFKYSGEDELVLKDTKTGIETPIVDGGTYEFTSNKGDDDMRFVIKKAPAVVTGVDEISGNNSGVQKFMHNGTMYIVRDGRIYSVEGVLVK